MSYKHQATILAIFPLLASTFGSGAYNAGSYNGAAGTPAPAINPVIAMGPFTLPLTGATLIGMGAILTAALAALAVWIYQRRKART